MSWTEFQENYMTAGTPDTDDQFLPSNWDNAKLRQMGSVYVTGVGSADEGYWAKDDGAGTWNATGLPYATLNGGAGWVENGFGPNTSGGDSATVTPVGGTSVLGQDQLKHMPTNPASRAGVFDWNPGTRTWTHESQRGSNGGVSKSGNTYIPSGRMKYAVNTFVSGYSKPFILTDTPFQVLFALDTAVGEDLSGFKYTQEQIQDYIVDGTPLPTLTPPAYFNDKFSEDVKILIEEANE
jgi:hypothetical protein